MFYMYTLAIPRSLKLARVTARPDVRVRSCGASGSR